MLFVEENRVLFAGDAVMNESFVAAGAATSMRAWLMAFDRVDAVPSGVYHVRVRALNAVGRNGPSSDVRVVVP